MDIKTVKQYVDFLDAVVEDGSELNIVDFGGKYLDSFGLAFYEIAEEKGHIEIHRPEDGYRHLGITLEGLHVLEMLTSFYNPKRISDLEKFVSMN